MGALLEPAVLFRETLNLEATGERRSERLSTGRYTLTDVRCKGCAKKLGWRYIEAASLVRGLPDPRPCMPACAAAWRELGFIVCVAMSHAASHASNCSGGVNSSGRAATSNVPLWGPPSVHKW